MQCLKRPIKCVSLLEYNLETHLLKSWENGVFYGNKIDAYNKKQWKSGSSSENHVNIQKTGKPFIDYVDMHGCGWKTLCETAGISADCTVLVSGDYFNAPIL